MSLRNFSVVVPEERGTSAQSEVATQRGVTFDAKNLLDRTLGEFHDGTQSRPLDLGLSSHLGTCAPTVSKHMDTMAERLKRAIAARGMTPGSLIKAAKLSRATIYFLLDGTTSAEKVRASTVEVICRALRIRREWLLEGKGSMNSDNDSRDHSATPIAIANDVHDIRLALSLTAKALAASIRPAGAALLKELEESGEPLADKSFLGELAKALRAEVGADHPASRAKHAPAHR